MTGAKFFIAAMLCIASGSASSETLMLASTTSTDRSGLFAYLLPLFKQAGLDVKVVPVGTGQAPNIARRGDADAILVHDLAAEGKFVAAGFGRRRDAVMYDDFVLIGPKTAPAATRGVDTVAALAEIITSNVPFVSRGDKSGARSAEIPYWTSAGPASQDGGDRECGCGMGRVEHGHRLRSLRAGQQEFFPNAGDQ